jgi:hypothetical protein
MDNRWKFTFEEFYSFAVDDPDSIFESGVVSKELRECNAFWTSWRGSICFFLLRHCPGSQTFIPLKDSGGQRPQTEWFFERRVPKSPKIVMYVVATCTLTRTAHLFLSSRLIKKRQRFQTIQRQVICINQREGEKESYPNLNRRL